MALTAPLAGIPPPPPESTDGSNDSANHHDLNLNRDNNNNNNNNNTGNSTNHVNLSKNAGGIAWAGSMVGSKNLNNLGFRYSTPSKRYRAADAVDAMDLNEDGTRRIQLPANVQVLFKNRAGDQLAESVLDLPTHSTVDDLTALVHSLQQDADDNNTDPSRGKIPYSFYVRIKKNGVEDDVEVTISLEDLLRQYHEYVSTEHTIELTYQPLAVFRVRPVTRCTDTLPGHTEAVLHVSYSPDGRRLASGGGDTMVRFWDVASATPKFTCAGHKNHVLATAWSPDGARFVSADKNGVFIIWDPATGKQVGQTPTKAHKQWVSSIAWQPLHRNPAGTCDLLATSSKDGTVKIWNTRTQSHVRTLSGHTDSVEVVKWGAEGLLYSASRDRTIKVWDEVRGVLVRTLTGHGHRVNTLALSTDAMCRTGPFDHQQIGRNPHVVIRFASPELAYEAACQRYQDYRSSQPVTADGRIEERLISGSDDFTLYLWHPVSSKHAIKRMTGHQQAVNHLAFSPDGRYFASASFDKKVKIWNGLSGEFLSTCTGHVGAVYQVAWSPDSRWLVSASKDSTAKLWDVPTGKKAKQTLPGHADEVYALDWSPTGHGGVATGSKDRTLKIWKH